MYLIHNTISTKQINIADYILSLRNSVNFAVMQVTKQAS